MENDDSILCGIELQEIRMEQTTQAFLFFPQGDLEPPKAELLGALYRCAKHDGFDIFFLCKDCKESVLEAIDDVMLYFVLFFMQFVFMVS